MENDNLKAQMLVHTTVIFIELVESILKSMLNLIFVSWKLTTTLMTTWFWILTVCCLYILSKDYEQ